MKTREKLFLLMKMNPLPFILYGIVIFLWNCMSIFSAICLQLLFDAFETMNQISKNIYFIVVVLVLVYMARGLTSFLIMGLEGWGGFSVDAFLKLNVMKKIFESYGACFPNKASGELLNIFRNDIGMLKSFLLQITEEFAICIYSCLVVVVLFRIDPLILFSVLAVSFFSVFLIRTGYKKLSEYQRKVRKMDGIVNGFVGEILSSVLAVKIAGATNSILSYFEELCKERGKVSIYQSVLRQILNSANQISFEIGEGLILILAFRMMREGSFSIGDFALFTFLFDSISNVISSTAQVVSEIPQVRIAAERIEKMLKLYRAEKPDQIYRKSYKGLENEILEIDVPMKTVKVKNLDCYTKDGRKILDQINITLKKGTVTVVSGKTASGKTMLLRTFLGLYPTQNGVIYWNGKKLEKQNINFMPPIMAYTPQNPNFFSESIKDNILPDKITKEKMKYRNIDAAIRLGILEDDMKELEYGVDTVLGMKGAKVSGGQKKRIALSRMYAREAEIYVIDDVSSALDTETEKKVWKQVKNQADKTFFISSNSKYALEIADQIVFLVNGRMEVYGNLEDALGKSENIRQMVGISG